MKPDTEEFRYPESLVHPDIRKSLCPNIRISNVSRNLGIRMCGYLETQQLYWTQQLLDSTMISHVSHRLNRSSIDLASAVCHVVKPRDSHGGQHDPFAVFDVTLTPVGLTTAGNVLGHRFWTLCEFHEVESIAQKMRPGRTIRHFGPALKRTWSAPHLV